MTSLKETNLELIKTLATSSLDKHTTLKPIESMNIKEFIELLSERESTNIVNNQFENERQKNNLYEYLSFLKINKANSSQIITNGLSVMFKYSTF